MSLALGCRHAFLQAGGVLARSSFGILYPYISHDGVGFVLEDTIPGSVSELANQVAKLFSVTHQELLQMIVRVHIDNPQRMEVLADLKKKLTEVKELQETAIGVCSLLAKCSGVETVKPLKKELEISLNQLTSGLKGEVPFQFSFGARTSRKGP